MEVMIPSSVQRMDLDFNNAIGSSFLSAPSSPTGFGDCVFSAPTSPTRISEFYREFNSFSGRIHRQGSRRSGSVSVPFDWEVRPGTPKSPKPEEAEEAIHQEDEEDVGLGFEFAFDIGQESETASLSAEELFDGGKIRPLKPPPRLQMEEQSSPRSAHVLSPRSPFSQGKKMIREALSPRRKNQRDPFEAAIENTRNRREQGRGRDMLKNPSRRTARSLSPYRVSAYPWEEEEKQVIHQVQDTTSQPSSTASPAATSSSSKSSSRKWRLRDFLLFRSSSEGRATDQKDPLRKYSGQFRRPEEVKNESFRSSNRRKVTAHEKLYATNKAAAEDLKKRTFLPYKQGLLGRLAFSPTAYAFTRP